MEQYFGNEHLHWFKRGEYIQRSVDPVDYMYFLSKGLAIVSRINEGGDETVIRYAKAPTFLGAPMIFSAHLLAHEVDTVITACSDCKIYKIPYQQFQALAKEHVEIYERLFVEQAQETRYFRNLMRYAAKGKSANAVALFLEHSIVEEDGALFLPNKITFTAMANFLHMHPVTVSKIVKRFIAEGLLTKQEGCVHVADLQKLKAYAAGKDCVYWKK